MKCRACGRALHGPRNKAYCDAQCRSAYRRKCYARNKNGVRDETRARMREHMRTGPARRMKQMARARRVAEGRAAWHEMPPAAMPPILARLFRTERRYRRRLTRGTGGSEDAKKFSRLRALMRQHVAIRGEPSPEVTSRLRAALDEIDPRDSQKAP